MTTAIQVADNLLKMYRDAKKPVNGIAIVKMTILVQAHHLLAFNKPAFVDPVLTWRYGPNIEDLYHAVKVYDKRDIPDSKVLGGYTITGDLYRTIENVFVKYSHKGSLDLSAMLNANNSSWRYAIENIGKNIPIPHDSLKQDAFL